LNGRKLPSSDADLGRDKRIQLAVHAAIRSRLPSKSWAEIDQPRRVGLQVVQLEIVVGAQFVEASAAY